MGALLKWLTGNGTKHDLMGKAVPLYRKQGDPIAAYLGADLRPTARCEECGVAVSKGKEEYAGELLLCFRCYRKGFKERKAR